MIACYDLARCPPTYDAVAFLVLAEVERLRRGDAHMDIRILPGPAGGFRADSLWPRSVEERVKIRDRVLVPLCGLLPSARTVEVAADRREYMGEWGVGEYYVGLPRIVGVLRGGGAWCRPLRASGRPNALTGRRVVTLTLREASHWPVRNSRVDEWMLAASEIVEMGFAVAIIRDSRLADTPLVGDGSPWLVQLADAATNVSLRAAWYGTAILNVGVSNGPMWMSIFMDAPTLMLRPTTNAAGGCYDDAFYARFGLPRGSQLPNSPPHQRLCWQEDTCANIVHAVEEMLMGSV